MKEPVSSQLQPARFQKYRGISLALSCAAPRLDSAGVRCTLHTASPPPIKWLFLTNFKHLLLQLCVFCHILLLVRAGSCLRCGTVCQEGKFCSVLWVWCHQLLIPHDLSHTTASSYVPCSHIFHRALTTVHLLDTGNLPWLIWRLAENCTTPAAISLLSTCWHRNLLWVTVGIHRSERIWRRTARVGFGSHGSRRKCMARQLWWRGVTTVFSYVKCCLQRRRKEILCSPWPHWMGAEVMGLNDRKNIQGSQ